MTVFINLCRLYRKVPLVQRVPFPNRELPGDSCTWSNPLPLTEVQRGSLQNAPRALGKTPSKEAQRHLLWMVWYSAEEENVSPSLSSTYLTDISLMRVFLGIASARHGMENPPSLVEAYRQEFAVENVSLWMDLTTLLILFDCF